MKHICVATLFVGLLPALLWGDTITMTKTDTWNSGDQSFFTGANWSNGEAPSAANDYVVGSGQTLYARNQASSGSIEFAGNSLTLNQNGAIYFWTNLAAWKDMPFVFNSLVLGPRSSLRTENTTTYGVVIQGDLTINSAVGSPVICTLSSSTNCTMRFDATLTGAAGTEIRGVSRFGILTPITGTGYLDFVGDASAYNGVVSAYSNVTIRVGGETGLENAEARLMQGNSHLQAFAVDSVTAPVVKSVDVRAADAGLVYDPELQLSIGALILCNGAVIDASKVTAEIGDASGFLVTTSYYQAGRVSVDMGHVELPYTLHRFPLLTLGDSVKGTLDATRFDLIHVNGNVSLQVEGKTLYVVNDDWFNPTGYVTLTKDDPYGWGSATNLYSYFYAGGWSDEMWPTSDKDYLVPEGVRFNLINNGSFASARDVALGKKADYYWTKIEFLGKSLSIMGTAVNDSQSTHVGYNMNITDLRLMRSGSILCTFSEGTSTTIAQNPTYFNYNRPNNTVTVYAPLAHPFTFMTGDKSSAIIFYSKLLGAEGTALMLRGSSSYGAKPESDANYSRCVRPIEFAGDNSGYYGSLLVGTNSILHMSSSFANATVRLLDATYSHLELAGANDAVLKLGSLVTPAAMSIAIPATNSLMMTTSSFGGDVNFVCESYVNGQVNVGKRLTTAKILVNGVEASVLPNGAVVTSAVPGSGTKDDPYVVDSAATKTLFLDGNASSILAAGAYYQINGLAPTSIQGTTELLRIAKGTALDLSKFSIGPAVVPFDQYELTTVSSGDEDVLVLKNKILPDRPSSTYTDWNAFMARNDIYYLATSDSTGTNPETKTRYTSYKGNYGAWRIGKYDAAVTNSTSPVAGYPHAIYPMLYSSRGYGTMMGIVGGDQGKFVGSSLTLCNLCYLRADFSGSSIDVDDLRVQGNSYLLNCGTTGGNFTIRGNMTVLSDASEAFAFVSQVTNGWTYTVNLEANLIGSSTRTLTAYPNSATGAYGTLKIVLKGDNSQYYGTVLAGKNNVLVLNSEGGLPNGAINLPAEATRLEIAGATTAVPVKSLTIADGKTLKLGGKGLEVTESCAFGETLNLDLSAATLDYGENVVLSAPEGTTLSTTTYSVTGLPENTTLAAVDNTLVVTKGRIDIGGGFTADQTAEGAFTITGNGALTADVAQKLRAEGVTSLTLGENVTGVEEGAFSKFYGLTQVTFKAMSCVTVGANAFLRCNSLENIVFEGESPAISDDAFVLQAAIYMKDGIPTIYTIPTVTINGYTRNVYGTNELKGSETSWTKITTEAQRTQFHFFKVVLEKN